MVLLVFVLSGCVQTFVARVYVVPSGSMKPELNGCDSCVNDRILVNKLSPLFSPPHQGDVVVFAAPDSWNKGYIPPRSNNKTLAVVQDFGSFFGLVVPRENTMVKRVIATGGQTVACLPGDSGVTVDNVPINNEFILQPAERVPNSGSVECGGRFFGPLTVPKDHIFVMGDNRTNSADSRFYTYDDNFGTVPIDNVIGTASAVVTPLERAHFIKRQKL